MHREIREAGGVLRGLSLRQAALLCWACTLPVGQAESRDDAGPRCETLQNSSDSVCPLPVLLLHCCYSVELSMPRQQSRVSLSQPPEPQEGERTETRRLSPEFCSWWNEHSLTLPWLTQPPPHPQAGACWYFSSSSIPLLQVLIERLYFIFYYFLTSPLFRNALAWHCYLHHVSYTIFIFFVIWFLRMSCHLANLILLRSIQTNLWVKKNEWKNKSKRQASPHFSTLHILYEIPAPEIYFLARWHLCI